MLESQVLISTMKNLAYRAGEEILKIYSQEFTVEYKDDNSPVTHADHKANELIVSGLRASYPDIPVLAEESMDEKSRLSKEYCFIVDPLDGTREFVNRNGEFCVNIALCRKGEPIAGLIYVPVLNELYYAALGEGAYFVSNSGEEERIHVSAQLGDIRLAVSRSHHAPELDMLIENNHIQHIIVAGSAYKGCLIARGEAEAYYRFGRTMEWDTAAMQILITEAGGIFNGMDDRPFVYNKENTANPMGFYAINRIENRLNLLNSH